jgi:hypothetical protein
MLLLVTRVVVHDKKTHILLYYQRAVELLIAKLITMTVVNKVAVFDLQRSRHHC